MNESFAMFMVDKDGVENEEGVRKRASLEFFHISSWALFLFTLFVYLRLEGGPSSFLKHEPTFSLLPYFTFKRLIAIKN